MKTTLQDIGNLEIEVRQMEGRVTIAKNDVANLERRKKELLAEAEGIKLTVETEAAQRMQESRQETARLAAEREKLEKEKLEAASLAKALKQEHSALEKAQEEARNAVANYKKMYEKLSRFVVMVRRESELL